MLIVSEPPCLDKETQTDTADFNKLTNGQTVQAKDVERDERKDKNIKEKTISEKTQNDTKCNVMNHDEKVKRSEKSDSL